MLTVIDEFTRECPAIEVSRRLRSDDVLHVLADLFVQHGPPDHINRRRRRPFGSTASICPALLMGSRQIDAFARLLGV